MAPKQPPDVRYAGIEQCHHPRPVSWSGCPTPERERLLNGVSGAVLEFGAGDGVKFLLYPPEVLEITVVEPDPGLRDLAREGCQGCRIPIRFPDGSYERLPVPTGSVDVVVSSLVLCCVPRLDETLNEIMRVLVPGGELRFHEHVRSSKPLAALAERLISPIWALAAGGCHPARDTPGSSPGPGSASSASTASNATGSLTSSEPHAAHNAP
ncbi:methyltransferase domain-containing protein [Nonomuraea sp. K274]|uniref:Methyltransferase domain-containing protein n=1 Tax=Nonomuraea cypriaca TaxID=1187855 RepID=A0A931F6Z5_9ACTN|nr:methyltransferase domain-containing protein [Nonomuraea cypriaca]MBF8193808.1 methyltransferase domain-containing protein [Nonomuraea cypriaca]